MRRWCAGAAVAMVVVGHGSAGAATFLSGGHLVAECEAEAGERLCLGYLMGVVDMETTASNLLRRPSSYCLPEQIPATTIRDVVLTFLREKAYAHLRRSASSLVLGALVDAYPCPREAPG